MTRQSLTDSIEALQYADYSCASGFSTDIYLDPEAQRVYTFLNTNSIPATAYHNIDVCILKVRNGAIAESVYSAVKELEDDLDQLIDLYQGSEWNGSNHIGRWDEAADDLQEYISQKRLEIAYYWESCDWFEPVTEDLKRAWQEGKTAEEIIDEQGCGDAIDGMCDRAEAIEWLESQIEEWKLESEDEE